MSSSFESSDIKFLLQTSLKDSGLAATQALKNNFAAYIFNYNKKPHKTYNKKRSNNSLESDL
ncbi:hypothetical protein STRMA_1312 [Streptococcus macacae NCTC 11558]|uniref:Uncharacterized protein n=1 Tax=Streptococcus macacae NCTC 11558 TaxID=764298 RepID=G5JXF6_9STRE|nr:hypothetical protein STRMA_1312 [Streptococcus macacae NCTC 11558]